MIVVTVSRSGGVAGMTRRWRVTLADEEWEELCTRERSLAEDPGSRDRFVYRVGDGSRSVVIAESQLDDRLRALLIRTGADGPGPGERR
jgi:hypothetical protein